MTEKSLNKERILIIDDEPQITNILCEILRDEYACQASFSAEEGLDLIRTNQFSIVISDVNMEGISGLEMVPQIASLAPDTVVIMMSAAQTIEAAINAMRVGAFDYLMKPFDLRQVETAVKRAVDHYALRVAKRHYETELEKEVQQRTAALRHTTEELEEQIAQRNRAEERLNYLAYHDLLTELPNRALFKDRLGQAMSLAQRDNQVLAVLFLSIDRFKTINDTVGPGITDQLICQIAERLRNHIREGDTLGYWGSDEFAFLFTQLSDTDGAFEIVRKIQSKLEGPFQLSKQEFYVTSSIGVSLYPFDGWDEERLMKNASVALCKAKEHGGNFHEFYTVGMNSQALMRLTVENNLRRAIERQEFVIHYQPKIDISAGRIAGAEALVRWNHPDGRLVPPAEFIPIAEDTGLIVSIDDWVLRKACEQLKQWQNVSEFPLSMSSNVSARQFQQPGFFASVDAMLKEVGVDPRYLELELTEGSIMTNPGIAVNTLNSLKNIGVSISVDDFGTGFSSLGYLKSLPLDTLKIDRSFVSDATIDPDDAALVMAIITLAHNLRLKVVAEGVEQRDQLKFLHLLRCDEIQGYLFSKPLPREEFEELLVRGQFTSNHWNGLREMLHLKRDPKKFLTAAA